MKINKSLVLSLFAVVGLFGSIASADACCKKVVPVCCAPVQTAVRVVEPVVQTVARVTRPVVQTAVRVVEPVVQTVVQPLCPNC